MHLYPSFLIWYGIDLRVYKVDENPALQHMCNIVEWSNYIFENMSDEDRDFLDGLVAKGDGHTINIEGIKGTIFLSPGYLNTLKDIQMRDYFELLYQNRELIGVGRTFKVFDNTTSEILHFESLIIQRNNAKQNFQNMIDRFNLEALNNNPSKTLLEMASTYSYCANL